MARKRSGTNKRSKSKRSSTSTSPTSEPAVAASMPEETVAAVPATTVDQPPSIDEASFVAAESTRSSNGTPGTGSGGNSSEHADDANVPDAGANDVEESDGKYTIDVAAVLAEPSAIAAAATEDQLEDLLSFAEDSAPHAKETADASHLHYVPVPIKSSSVDMEDSQAELLASILNSSLYSSSFSHSTSDELHAVESDKDAGVADVVMHGGSDESDLSCFADDVVIGSNVNASDAIARPYVITPGAMLDSGGSDDVLLLTPETVANSSATVDGATVRYGESAGSDALAVASIDSGEIEAAATAGLRVSTEIAACGAVESSGVLLEEHDMCSSGDLVSGEHSIAESFIHVDGSVGDSEHIAERAAEPEQKADLEGVPEKGSEPTERAVSEIMDNAKDTARDAAKDASKKADKAAASAKNAVDEASKDIADASNDAASKAKDIIDSASKSVRDAAASANDRAHDAMSKARESGEKLAKKAKEEATEAEKAVRRQAKCTPPATLKVLGIVAVALAAVSGYYFRLPGRQNQRIGFAGGVASVVVGLGTLATAFIKRNA